MAILNATISLLLLASSASFYSNITEPYPQMVNHTLVTEIVRSVRKLYDFKNFVFFISENLLRDLGYAEIIFENIRQAFPTAPPKVISSREQFKMSRFLSKPTLCLILTTGKEDEVMELSASSMKGVRFFRTMFILFPIMETEEIYDSFEQFTEFYDNIRQIYEWIWKKQFLNTLLISIKNSIFIYEPYPTGNVVNKTENWTATDFFLDYGMNLKGYQVQTTIRQDMPRVFHVSRYSKGVIKNELSGVSGKLFLDFLRAVNATYNDTCKGSDYLEDVNYKSINALVEQKELEIGVNSYTAMIASLAGTSYPVGINDWCVMVPYQNRSPEHLYLQGCFTDNSWFLVFFSVFYLMLGIWICTPSPERDLSLSFLQSICTITLTVPLRLMTLPYIRLRFLFLLFFVLGFLLTNLFMAKMSSFLSTPTQQKQIDTIEDVIEAKLQILVLDYEYEKILTMNYPQEFLDLIIVTSKGELDQHRTVFNSSFGYSSQSDRWEFLNKQQRYLEKPLFRLSSICMGPFYHIFPIQRDSHLAQPLLNFIMASTQFGLWSHWQQEAFSDALHMNYVHLLYNKLYPVPLTLVFFRWIWYISWLGLILAGLAFMFEMKGMSLEVCRRCVRRLVRKIKAQIYEL